MCNELNLNLGFFYLFFFYLLLNSLNSSFLFYFFLPIEKSSFFSKRNDLTFVALFDDHSLPSYVEMLPSFPPVSYHVLSVSLSSFSLPAMTEIKMRELKEVKLYPVFLHI